MEVATGQSFHLIVGNNASGKTTLLDGLCTGLSPWLQGLDKNLDSRNIEANDIQRRHLRVADVSSVEESAETIVSLILNTEEGAHTVTRYRRGIAGRTSHSPDKAVSQKSKAFVRYAEATAAAVKRGEPMILPLLCYYGTGRLWLTPKKTTRRQIESRSRLAGYRTSMDPRCDPKDFKDWFKAQEWSAYQKKAESPLFRVVREAVLSCLEGAQSIWFNPDPHVMDVMVDFGARGIQPFDNLSDGQRNIVALIGDIAIKAAQLNPHLGAELLTRTPGVVLIDELDLHLHPKWQRRIVADLKRCFPLVQFFCTTHSPVIIGEVPREEIIVMHDDGTTGQPSVAYGADANWILTQVMGCAEPRDAAVAKLIQQIENALEDGELASAEQGLTKLRAQTGEAEASVIRLSAQLQTEKDLADAAD